MASFSPEKYSSMKYRRCGTSGLKLPVLSLGFWQSLGEPGREEECRKCMYHAFDHGITHFDLANNYGPPPGNSEISVGKILKDMPRDELIISSKAGYLMWPGPYGTGGSRKYLLASLDQSLKRLGLDYVDIYYHHCPDAETPIEESMSALETVVRQGKALYVGVSSYSGKQFNEAAGIMKRREWTPLIIHQPYYNMLRRGSETDLFPHTTQSGAGVIAFCPLEGGLLTSKYLNGVPKDSRAGRAESWPTFYQKNKADGTIDKVARLNEIALARGQSLAQMALTWILRDERVTSALIGASRVEQITENLKAVNAPPLTGEELLRIDSVLA